MMPFGNIITITIMEVTNEFLHLILSLKLAEEELNRDF